MKELKMKSKVAKLNLILLGIIILLLGLWLITSQKNSGPIIPEEVGFVYSPPRQIGNFQLIDFDSNVINENRFTGKWWLVYFGFTFCPDACPLALSDMKKIKASFDEKINQNTNFVFISVDPDRDTPQRLKEYVNYYDPEFFAATGEAEELQKLATKMGVAFVVPEAPEDENYVVGHSTFMLLVNPLTELVAIFRVPHDPENVAEGVERIQKHFDDL